MYAINYLPARDISKSLTGCCPPFNPADWDGQEFTFHQKPFMKITTRSFYHIPLNMNAKMMEAMAQVEDANATSPDYLMLSDEVSPWKAEHYLAVRRDVSGAEMVRLSGKYMSKVFEGPYQNMRAWHDELIDFVKAKGKVPVKTYFNYAMCPNCAKAYGHNYVVGFEQIA